jgi:quinol-cytochrome oxidoreductase complex cytochrome b subunit
MHLIALHEHGSNNPLGITSNVDRIRFHPYYSFKDLVGLFVFFFLFAYFVFFNPNFFGESDNYIPANPLVTPISIVPEFYLLPFYAILRSIPHKLLGVIGMIAAILILLITPITDTSRIRSMQFRPIMKFFFWLFVANFLILGWIGSQHPEEPLVLIGQLSTVYYFAYFLVLLPAIGIIENTLFDLGTNTKSINTPQNENLMKTIKVTFY